MIKSSYNRSNANHYSPPSSPPSTTTAGTFARPGVRSPIPNALTYTCLRSKLPRQPPLDLLRRSLPLQMRQLLSSPSKVGLPRLPLPGAASSYPTLSTLSASGSCPSVRASPDGASPDEASRPAGGAGTAAESTAATARRSLQRYNRRDLSSD